jgi:hypothetical protein
MNTPSTRCRQPSKLGQYSRKPSSSSNPPVKFITMEEIYRIMCDPNESYTIVKPIARRP